jgi:hypothetical protein
MFSLFFCRRFLWVVCIHFWYLWFWYIWYLWVFLVLMFCGCGLVRFMSNISVVGALRQFFLLITFSMVPKGNGSTLLSLLASSILPLCRGTWKPSVPICSKWKNLGSLPSQCFSPNFSVRDVSFLFQIFYTNFNSFMNIGKAGAFICQICSYFLYYACQGYLAFFDDFIVCMCSAFMSHFTFLLTYRGSEHFQHFCPKKGSHYLWMCHCHRRECRHPCGRVASRSHACLVRRRLAMARELLAGLHTCRWSQAELDGLHWFVSALEGRPVPFQNTTQGLSSEWIGI